MDELVFREKLFGDVIQVIVYDSGSRNHILNILNKMYKEALRLEKIFNFYDLKSELSELNKKRKMEVSEELVEVIKMSIEFSKITDGKYDITLGKNIYERKSKLPLSKLKCSYKDIKIKNNFVELLNEDVIIDLGSIAKGYITDKLNDFLILHGLKEFLIDSRGDIRISGNLEHVIDIQHPRRKGDVLKSVKVKNKAIATSGDYKQYYGKYKNSHIINSNEIISVTVIADSLWKADALATAIFVSDENKIKKLIKKYKDCSFFIVKNKESLEYNKFGEFIYEK